MYCTEFKLCPKHFLKNAIARSTCLSVNCGVRQRRDVKESCNSQKICSRLGTDCPQTNICAYWRWIIDREKKTIWMSSTFWTDLLLRFKSFSLIGDVAADFLPLNFKGVPNSRLAPVLVHAVTIEMGEELGDLSLPWQLSRWGDLGGVKSALGVGRSWAFCCRRSSLIWGT